ncbi:MAG TPA: alkaline phosphatase family protein [Thermoanaerobaculia bacterium]|nr:alkaline phosphatase family protein [Thermoanaerobaculia bacterium]
MRKLLSFPLLLALACAPAAPPAPKIAPPPQFAPTAVAQRVVLVSFDGLGADALARQTNLPAFEALVRDGAAARSIPVNPTVTSSTHVSILTGADPQKHGIVSNRFHLAGTAPEVTTRGMDTTIDVETLVTAARRQGKRVGAVTFPTVDATSPERTADFGIVWKTPLTQAKVLKLTRADFKREWVPPTWTQRPQRRASFSPVMRARVEWGVPKVVRMDVDVVAYDTTDDARENYDTYRVETKDEELPFDAHGWFAISRQTENGLAGSWSKILETQPALEVTLYWGAISRTTAYPDSYRELLDREVGFWPGTPDEMSDIDAPTFAQQIDRIAGFVTRAQTLTIRTMDFDLLLAYQPQVDEAQHNFLGYDESVIHGAFLAADRAVQAIRAELDPARDALVVTGDHGLTGFDRELRINRLLAERGFAPRWRGYVSGSVAHLYRYDSTPDDEAVVKMLTASGFFERIEKKNATHHRNAGDIIAMTFPNIELSASAEAPVVAEPQSYGHHGALNTHRELHTVIFAAGAGVPRGSFGEIAQTKIARFVSGLLGIQPPNTAE